MTPERLFHELLGLGKQWRVVRCDYQTQDDGGEQTAGGVVRLWVEETPVLWAEESASAKQVVCCYDHVEELVWRHLNVFEHRCEIHCRLPRGQRAGDGSV